MIVYAGKPPPLPPQKNKHEKKKREIIDLYTVKQK